MCGFMIFVYIITMGIPAMLYDDMGRKRLNPYIKDLRAGTRNTIVIVLIAFYPLTTLAILFLLVKRAYKDIRKDLGDRKGK